MIVTACVAKDEVEYNRSGNLHVLNLASGERMDLCGHTVPLNLVKTIAVLDDPSERTPGAAPHVVAKKAKLPWRSHPRGMEEFSHLRDPHSTALFYATVTDVCFTNSGKYFISSGCDGNCMLWNAKNGSLLRIFVGNAFFQDSPSGRSSGHVYEVPAWNNQSYIGTRRTASYTAGTFHTLEPILTMECDHYNSVAELQPGAQLPAGWPTVTPQVTRIIAHPDHEHIFASGVSDGSVWLWDLRGTSSVLSRGNSSQRKPLMALPSSSQGIGSNHANLPTARRPSFNISVEIISRRPDMSNAIRHSMDGLMVGNPRGGTAALVFGRHDYNHVLVSFHEPPIRGKSKMNFYDINTGKQMGSWDQFSRFTEPSALCISDSGRMIGVGTVKDRHAYLVDMKSRSTMVQMFADQEDINAISISPCETFVACGSTVPDKAQHENLKVFDRRYPKHPLLQYDFRISDGSVDNDGITAIQWLQSNGTSPFGHNRVMLSGHSDGCVRFIDPTLSQTDAIIHGLDTVDGGITSLSILNNFETGQYLNSIRTDLDELLVPLSSRDPEPDLSSFGDQRRSSFFDFDETVISCGTSSGKVYVFSQNPSSVRGLQEVANV